jgi:hypothetical protein
MSNRLTARQVVDAYIQKGMIAYFGWFVTAAGEHLCCCGLTAFFCEKHELVNDQTVMRGIIKARAYPAGYTPSYIGGFMVGFDNSEDMSEYADDVAEYNIGVADGKEAREAVKAADLEYKEPPDYED